jgi:hypothetical protein
VTASEAGLTLITASVFVIDNNPTSGGFTGLRCFLAVNGSAQLPRKTLTLRDTGDGFYPDSQSVTLLGRQALSAGDVVGVACDPNDSDVSEASGDASLELARGSS